MSRVVFEETFHAYWLPGADAVADIEAPTTDEIDDGVEYTSWIPRNGFKFGHGQAKVDNSDIASDFDSELMGTWNAKNFGVTFKRDNDAGEDDPWVDFDRNDEGFWVICPFAAAAEGARCYVYPAQAGVGVPMDTAANEQQKFSLEFAITSEPSLKSVIAGAS